MTTEPHEMTSEAPDVREQAGKPRAGTLRLSAQQEGDHVFLHY